MAKNIIVSINAADGSVYTNAKSLGINGDNLGAPGLMILDYYPTYPGDESAYDTKEFPNIYK